MEAEISFLFGFHSQPILAGGFQQGVGAYDVGFDKVCGAVYGAVNVAFGGQVHDGVWLVLGQYAVYFGAVADVDLLEAVALVVADLGQAFEVADRKSTRLNSSHVRISYAVFCLKKKKNQNNMLHDIYIEYI